MNFKKILFLVLPSILVFPVSAFAEVAACKNPKVNCTNDLCDLTCNFALSIYNATGALVLIGWIVVGGMFLLAAGEPGKLSAAKTALFIVIAGTLILILAPIAVPFVGALFGVS